MSSLSNRRIVLGVSGGIAAYKSADLVRRLMDAGARVRVVMTRAAAAFVAPLTFQALSGNPVHLDLLDQAAEGAMGHIELARWADSVVVAPASADIMARLALGLADDLLSTLCLATEAPITLAPAMNRVMWAHPATQANRATLASRGVSFIGPAEGDQACGEIGSGRMSEPLEIVSVLAAAQNAGPLRERTVMITAGPTREAVDPVRYLTNRSSGKMGFALAQAARRAGARVILVSGPTTQDTPEGCERVDVESAEDMLGAVMAGIEQVDIFIGAAAVSDYRPVSTAPEKIKKTGERLNVVLVRNPDILATVAALPVAPFTVGFAAETERVAEYARAKMREKKLDMIAANWVGGRQTGFDVDDNALEVFWGDGHAQLDRAAKSRVAEQLMALVVEKFYEKNRIENPGPQAG